MNELLNGVIANNKFLVALETRLINIEAKIDAMNKPIEINDNCESHNIAIPREYPQSAGEEIVAETL